MDPILTNPQTNFRPISTGDPRSGRVSKDQAEEAVRVLLRYVGADIHREGLLKTPHRVAKAWLEMTSGEAEDPDEILSTIFDGEGCDEMVVCKGISFVSLCEHHVLPFVGTATVAYIPDGKIVGLSKLARLVHCYAKRLQVQERLTSQIANKLSYNLRTKGVGVILQAHHSCMSCRGVGESSDMITSRMTGAFRDDPACRAELFALARK